MQIPALEPSFGPAWINKAQALNAMGGYDEAILACNKAIHLDSASAEAWYAKALILEKESQEALAKAKELAQISHRIVANSNELTICATYLCI